MKKIILTTLMIIAFCFSGYAVDYHKLIIGKWKVIMDDDIITMIFTDDNKMIVDEFIPSLNKTQINIYNYSIVKNIIYLVSIDNKEKLKLEIVLLNQNEGYLYNHKNNKNFKIIRTAE